MMRVLLDTNIVIHREASTVVNEEVGELFRWLDRLKCEKCVHPITIAEINNHKDEKVRKSFRIKLDSYRELKTEAPLKDEIRVLIETQDRDENDRNDSRVLNEVLSGRVDLLLTEDKAIHEKASILGIFDKVFSIQSFLERATEQNPELVDYSVLSVKKEYFGKLDIGDRFFQSFKEDYVPFEKWFNGKSDEIAYICRKNDVLSAFLYVKVEEENENYSDIIPTFDRKKRLKISSFKVTIYGHYLGERFLKIVFDNALRFRVRQIYVTIFDKRPDQVWLIKLLEQWGFRYHGIKRSESGEEKVFVRDLDGVVNLGSPKLSYPYLSINSNIFMVSIRPEYHTELFPDSILRTESPEDFVENQPHRNSISKIFVSRSLERDLRSGDVIVFYRIGDRLPKIHTSVITTIGVVENVASEIKDETDLIHKCRGRSVFSDAELITEWNRLPNFRPFVVNFLYVYSLPKRLTLEKLLELGVVAGIDKAPRGFTGITKEQFSLIIKESMTDESIIVD